MAGKHADMVGHLAVEWNVYCSIESSSAMRQATWQCFRSLMALWRRYLGLSVCQVIIIIMFVCESVSVIVKYRLVFSCVLCVRWHNVFFLVYFIMKAIF